VTFFAPPRAATLDRRLIGIGMGLCCVMFGLFLLPRREVRLSADAGCTVVPGP